MVFALFVMPAAVAALSAAAGVKKAGAVNLIRGGLATLGAPVVAATMPPRLVTREEYRRWSTTDSADEVRAIDRLGEVRALAAGVVAVRRPR